MCTFTHLPSQNHDCLLYCTTSHVFASDKELITGYLPVAANTEDGRVFRDGRAVQMEVGKVFIRKVTAIR
jgi:hypothetical protein